MGSQNGGLRSLVKNDGSPSSRVHWTGGDPQRPCAGVGDGRSGLLPRPIVAIFEHFSGFEFFLLPNRVHARPLAANANRSASSADTLRENTTHFTGIAL